MTSTEKDSMFTLGTYGYAVLDESPRSVIGSITTIKSGNRVWSPTFYYPYVNYDLLGTITRLGLLSASWPGVIPT